MIVILSREDGEGSQDAQPKILRYAQDDGLVFAAQDDGGVEP